MSNFNNAENKKLRRYKYFLIVDEVGKVMAWDSVGKYICYCTTDHWIDSPFPAVLYTYATAMKIIGKDPINKHHIVPVKLPKL